MANPNIKRAVRVALVAASAGGAALYGAASVAQEAELEQVIVTGSRIPQPNLEGTSPVSLITAQDVAVQGVQQVEDLMNNMPQVFAGQGAMLSNGSTGTATVDLRGLGPSRTMVLVNGRRMVAGSPRIGGESPDLNQIPAPLIERVEVLTGGASAVYGSDAVAGVVNFIMKDDFEGIQLDVNHSFYNHENDNDVGEVVEYWGFEPAPKHIGSDGASTEISLLMGSNFADDRGNATLFIGWRDTDALLQSERDYSACSLGADSRYYDGAFYCGGSSASYPGRFRPRIEGTDPSWTIADSSGGIREWEYPNDLYNFGPLNYWQRPDERWSVSAFMNYNVTDSAEIYGEFMFMDDRSTSQIAPSGIFAYGEYTVPCDGSNPLVSAAMLNELCFNRPDPLTVADIADVGIARRNVEGGGRQDDIRHTSYRGVVGVKGDVWENWNYDVSATYSTVVFSETYLNDFSTARTARAMDVIEDPDTGLPACRSAVDGTDPNCVPYDIWNLGGVTPEALAYLQIPLFSKGDTELKTVTASLAADLGNYGVKLPTANDGIGVAFGANYYETALDLKTDPNFESGDGAGQGGPTIGQSGGYNAMEFFGEVRVPILQGMAFADSLLLNASYRRSDYSEPVDESTDTYGVGLEWAPVADIKFRGSYQHAVRAPGIIELYQAQGLGLFNMGSDPCAGEIDPNTGLIPSGYTAAQCALTDLDPSLYGTGDVESNNAQQYNALFSGSTDLIPETADSYTVGFVFQPRFLEGFSLTVDYFDISVEDVIASMPPTVSIAQCLAGGADFCARIHRDENGSLFASQDGYVDAYNQNIGGLDTTGWDIEVGYRTDIGDMGSLNFRLNGTVLDELITTPVKGALSVGEYDCAGLYGTTCGVPAPEWRHTARVTWATPWNLDLTMAWRYYDEVEVDTSTDQPLLAPSVPPAKADLKMDAQDYIDLAATWTFLEAYTVRLGMNNVLDEDPPVAGQGSVGAGFGNGNTFPQVYDALGRYVFVNLSAKF
ncbi:MAG TPA: TonB-dependent receptor [Steroidobacteraceae bacterium]|nr:TonB-dependent receptor [Steroidobacteraceae bacterium]